MDKEENNILFSDAGEWESWLEINAEKSPGIWLRIAKKNSGITSVTYDQALEVSLCYGWIDSKRKAWDELSFIQWFSPRKQKAIWSKINREKAEWLIKENRMKPSGLLAVEIARKNGNWDKAYEPQSQISIPDDFLKELNKSKIAAEFFKNLDSRNRYAILHRIQVIKRPDKRAEKIIQFVSMLDQQKKLY